MSKNLKNILKLSANKLSKPKNILFKNENYRTKYKSYKEAINHCTNDAYEEKELIEVILKKTKLFVNRLKTDIIPIWETSAYSLISILNPIINNNSNQINVIDFGGACGAHYFHLRSLIDKKIKLKWIVIETPTMVKYAKEFESDELSFFDNFDDAINYIGNIDLLHTSGTLQCVDNPHSYLNKILECNASWLIFNRLGLNNFNRDVITIHKSKLSWNGLGELNEIKNDKWIKYPFCFISEQKFTQKIEEKYKIIAKFDDKSGIYEIAGEQIVGYGLLCKLK